MTNIDITAAARIFDFGWSCAVDDVFLGREQDAASDMELTNPAGAAEYAAGYAAAVRFMGGVALVPARCAPESRYCDTGTVFPVRFDDLNGGTCAR